MPIPDITNLTVTELRELIEAASSAFYAAEAEQKQQVQARRDAIGDAITALETLLGPAEGDPGVDSIRAVRRYDEQTMGENAGLALNLAFTGLEQLTTTVLNLAHVIEGS